MEGVFKFWQNVEQRAKGLMPPQVFPAVVKEVDEDMRTCTVRINDNVDFEDVRLYAVADDSLKGFCLIPAKDSVVLVGAMEGNRDFYVVMFSEVDKVLGSIGDKTEILVQATELKAKLDEVEFEVKENNVNVKAKEITFNDGGNGGLIKIAKLTEKINNLVDSFNKHTHTIASISVPGTGLSDSLEGPITGSATAVNVKVPTPDQEAQTLDSNYYEDTKITH